MARKAKYKTPYKDLLPPLSTQERAALEASIKLHKIQDPIKVDEAGNVLDGHNRLEIDPQAPATVVKGLTDAEKEAYVYQCNHRRRNLSLNQRQELGKAMKATAERLRIENPKKNTQARIAALLGVGQQTVSDWLRRNTGSGNATKGSVTDPVTDGRVKVSPKAHPCILQRVEGGESQAHVAADYGLAQKQISRIVNQERKAEETRRQREAEARKRKGNCGVICGDFREAVINADSIDMILTDPPYDIEATELYADIAELGANALAPGGWLLAYGGKSHLPLVMEALSRFDGLEYAWTFCVLHTGGDARFRKFRLRTGWKPVLAFYRPPLRVSWDWFRDVVSGGKEKADHPWQQAEAEAAHFIESLCPPKGIVLDPCCGSGTVLAAAKQSGRRWLGYEIDSEHAETARKRLDDATV